MKTIEYPTVRWARELPDHPAVIAANRSISYSELDTFIANAASALHSHGVAAGDRVVVSGANSWEWIVIIHALSRLAAVHVPLGTRILRSQADDFRRVYSPRVILSDQASSHLWSDSIPIAACVQGAGNAGSHTLTPDIDPDALHSIVQTSGSEGEPKGVCLTFRNHLASALGSALNLGVRPDDRWLLNLPLDRIGGLAIAIRAAIYGTTVVIHDRFDADEVWRSIDEDRVTQLSVVATTLRRVLDTAPGRRCPEYVRSVMVGGGPVPASLIDEARERGFPSLPTYGLTETSSQIATLSPVAAESKRHTAGFALPLAEIETRGEDGAVMPPDIEGQIHVRGPMVSDGYWTDDGRIESSLDSDGWLSTNDIGSIDADGYVSISGRADNVIISGGEKMHAEEIENVLMMHDSIARAVVVSLEDAEWGQSPIAIVELVPGSDCDGDQFKKHVLDHLPKHKCPRRFEILDAIPILPSGKPDRQAIRSHYRT